MGFVASEVAVKRFPPIDIIPRVMLMVMIVMMMGMVTVIMVMMMGVSALVVSYENKYSSASGMA